MLQLHQPPRLGCFSTTRRSVRVLHTSPPRKGQITLPGGQKQSTRPLSEWRESQGCVEGAGEVGGGGGCSSWSSLLGAGRVFGSAHCIISISPNLPRKRRSGNTALLRASASVLDVARCSCSPGRRGDASARAGPSDQYTRSMPFIRSHDESGPVSGPAQDIQVYPPLCWISLASVKTRKRKVSSAYVESQIAFW